MQFRSSHENRAATDGDDDGDVVDNAVPAVDPDSDAVEVVVVVVVVVKTVASFHDDAETSKRQVGAVTSSICIIPRMWVGTNDRDADDSSTKVVPACSTYNTLL